MPATVRASLLAALSLSLLASTALADAPVVGFGEVRPQPVPCVDETAMPRPAEGAFGALPASPEHSQLFPSYSWPLERKLRDNYILVNYIDHDATAGIQDYQGGAWSYDGHNGTDITLYNFRLMDRGQRILAAAPGTVFFTTWNKVDRNTGAPFPDTENNVLVDNGDGTTTWYLHLRRNSLTVQAGDVISRGTILGLVGSSGFSTDAHLHFEAGTYGPSTWTPRDPWNGPFNALPSLWASQLPYVGTDHLWIADAGMTTQTAAGGNLANISGLYFKERMTQPAVLGANEPFLPFWMQIQGLAGDAYRIEILRPDGSLYSFVNYSLPGNFQYGWHYWYWAWGPGNVPASTYGTWNARVLINSVEVKRVPFQVGATTVYGPRFSPVAGRSYRLNGVVQKDTVHVSPLGGPVTYSLLNAPAGVTLVDSILTIPATSSQPTRSAYFNVIATDAGARRDTAWFHMVDLGKPLDPIVGVTGPAPRAGGFDLAPGAPNPFTGTTRLDYTLARESRVTLAVFDVAGREVRRLEAGRRAAGTHSAAWDGRDDAGRRLANGLYLARLDVDGRSSVRNLVMLK